MEAQLDPVQILLCLAGGMNMKETSKSLGFSYDWVREVMVSVRRDLDARSNEQAIARAFAMGYITIARDARIPTATTSGRLFLRS